MRRAGSCQRWRIGGNSEHSEPPVRCKLKLKRCSWLFPIQKSLHIHTAGRTPGAFWKLSNDSSGWICQIILPCKPKLPLPSFFHFSSFQSLWTSKSRHFGQDFDMHHTMDITCPLHTGRQLFTAWPFRLLQGQYLSGPSDPPESHVSPSWPSFLGDNECVNKFTWILMSRMAEIQFQPD